MEEPIYSSAVREMPQEDRPRERLARLGPEALRDAELLAVLFRTGTRKQGAVAVYASATHACFSEGTLENLEAGGLEQVVITDLKENTFFATIHLLRGGEQFTIDARPSDAMALALRAAAPIFVERQVLDKSEGSTEGGECDQAERLRRWLETVDPDELGKYEM